MRQKGFSPGSNLDGQPVPRPVIPGEMARRFREFDWSRTPLGPPDRWPESWRNAVQIILDSSFPTAVGLGPELIYVYNDAFIPLGGPARHPSSFGKPIPDAWWEIWEPVLEPRFAHTLRTGQATGEADLLMALERSGYLEETFITFSFAALRGGNGETNGIFCTAIETTSRVIADRQLKCLRALAARSAFAETPETACQSAVGTLEGNPRDLPFGLIYLLDENGERAHLAGTVGLESLPSCVPRSLDLASDQDRWQLSRVASNRGPAVINDVRPLIESSLHARDLIPTCATASPIGGLGNERLAGILIAGANPMRPLSQSQAFHGLVAAQLETAISSARAKQHIQERARALAELDRAKTVFFGNVSHELRTPLTLLLAPLDEVLGHGRLDEGDRALVATARRGGGRLLKLVNSLLEFSRIEAGRIDAIYEPTDLATLTADLASLFRSAFERAGLTLTLECPALAEPVFVDRDMWEKIVLNLISNAFKFTFAGGVRVSQTLTDRQVRLEVSDTGCGIAPDELPRLFDRFFRGRAAGARAYDGSGIGLSLVHELVKLHGGRLEAFSELGRGTTVIVSIPRGSEHLDAAQVRGSTRMDRASVAALPFVEEALGWLPDPAPSARSGLDQLQGHSAQEPASGTEQCERMRILVVDDNADMRRYLERLLGKRWTVETAGDGATALACVQAHAPDLVLSDVMMPGMDGFGFMRALRENPATARIPIMLLSARAGEEASIEGMRAGADDYVVKPFSARELLARIEARLAQARLRAVEHRSREVAEAANRARDEFFATLSHELRTPLMAVLGWTSLLKGQRLSAEDMAYAVDIIERNARIQRRLLDDLLDVSRIVTDRLRIVVRPVPSLSLIVSTVTDSFRPVALAKGLSIVTALSADAGPLGGDFERLQQVVWNLLSNAIRCTPPGGRIDIRCERLDLEVQLSIRDSGRGIAREALPHLFERYWQGKQPGHSQRGLGLGLAIAHRIVELHRGTITAHSDGEGMGATFVVCLPVDPNTTQQAGEPTRDRGAHPALSGLEAAEAPTLSDPIVQTPTVVGSGEAPTSADARMLDAVTLSAERESMAANMSPEALEVSSGLRAEDELASAATRILLVEDHDGIARACQRLLASHGHLVVRAAGLRGAMAAIASQPFDLLICDLRLPDGHGFDLLTSLRSGRCDAHQSQLPAIAMSGSAYDDDIARSLEAGFDSYLVKPFDEEALLIAIAEATRKSHKLVRETHT